MEPYYHVGSIVFVDKHVTPEEIQVGDPITFHLENGAVATHRVIEIDEEAREFTTKAMPMCSGYGTFSSKIGWAGGHLNSMDWLHPVIYANAKRNV